MNPSDFKWGDVDANGQKRLWHEQSGYFIEFSYWESQGYYYITCSPAEGFPKKSFKIDLWHNVLSLVQRWAFNLRQQIDAPDLWGQLGKYTAYLSLPPAEELPPDEPISAVDAAEIEDRLWLFADKVEKRFNLVGDDLKFLRYQTDVLIDIAKRSSNKAFVYSAVGVIATIAMSLAMSPEQVKALWQLLHDTLSPFLFLQ